MTVRTNLTLRQMIITHKKYVGNFGGEGGIRPAALGQCRRPARGTKKPFTGWFFPATGGPFPSHPSFFYAARKRDRKCDLFFVAEKEGFEPSRQSPQPTPLAGEPLTATWVLLHAMLCCYWMSGDVDPSVSAK